MDFAGFASAAWLALTPLPPALVMGQSSIAAQAPAIAPGEIRLEVASRGVSVNQADRATLTLNLRCSGPTTAEARAEVRALADQLIVELVETGVPRQSISVDEPFGRAGFVGNEAMADLIANTREGAPKPVRTASLALQVALTDISLLPAVRKILDQRDAVVLESPAFELSDDRAARRAAIAEAVRNARLDAEAYAATVGMRVSRILSIRDQDTQPSMMPEYREMVERIGILRGHPAGEVETTVRVAVEFVLAPE